ncbi:MAG TPA: hypothetical protein VE998_03980 [Terriglobales bacterium]|nr:hypothetical protein [Terriglobales bacterium]
MVFLDLSGLAAGILVALSGSWARGIAASMICSGTLVPLGNCFKNRREVARINARTR